MAHVASAGTILIKDGAQLPDTLLFDSEPYSPGWKIVTNPDRYTLDRAISGLRWTYFYLAGDVQASVLGFGSQKVQKAIEKIVAMPELAKFNSLEITSVTRKRFLGIPFTTVTAHSRHIQESWAIFRAPGAPQWAPVMKLAA